MVCRELGFRKATMIYSSAAKKSGVMWMKNVQCNGNEKSLVLCFHDGWKHHTCTDTRQVGAVCSVPEGRT